MTHTPPERLKVEHAIGGSTHPDRTILETLQERRRYVRRRAGKSAQRLQNSVSRRPLKSTPAVDRKKLVFVTGLHRSGTSVIHRILRATDGISGFDNTGHPQDEGQFLQSIVPSGRPFGGPGKFAFDPNAHMTEKSKLVSSANRNKLIREWGAYWDLNQPVLLEKSPPTIVRTRFFQALFPEALFIIVVRHPIPVSIATQKWSKTSLTELLLHWHVAHQRLLNDIPHLNNVLLYRYEDFVSAPEDILSRLGSFTDIPISHRTEPVADRNQAYFKRWESYPSGETQVLAPMINHPLSPLDTFGYSLTRPYIATPESTSVLSP